MSPSISAPSVSEQGPAQVEVLSSGSINSGLQEDLHSQISQWLPLREDGMALETSLLPGPGEYQLGAKRLVVNGGARYVEELEGLDDRNHILKYAIISYPGASNPFPHSLVNFHAIMRCRSVTVGNATFLEWTGAFDTEAEGMARMKHEIEAWMTSGVVSLERYIILKRSPRLPAPVSSNPIGARAARSGSPRPRHTVPMGARSQEDLQMLLKSSALGHL